MKPLFAMAVAIYFCVGIFTFGHSAAASETWLEGHCGTPQAKNDACYVSPGITGILSASLWPLYWSWELQR